MATKLHSGNYTELESTMAAGAGVSRQKAREWLIAWRDLAMGEMLDGYDFYIIATGYLRAHHSIRANTVNPRDGTHLGARHLRSVRLVQSEPLSNALN